MFAEWTLKQLEMTLIFISLGYETIKLWNDDKPQEINERQ